MQVSSRRPVQAARRAYALTPEPLAAAAGWIEEVGAAWDERLGALKRLLKTGESTGR